MTASAPDGGTSTAGTAMWTKASVLGSGAALAALAALLVAATLALLAGPAGASTTAPTDERSSVVSIEPATSVVDVSIVGGDTYVQLRVVPGHEVVVLGYDQEPYLRITADGAVQANEVSPSTYLNLDRYAQTAVPDVADAHHPPEWQTVGQGGTVRWHDHRIHWMTPAVTPTVDADGTIQDWTISMLVDGTTTTVAGHLVRAPAPVVAPFIVATVLVAIGGIVLGRRRPTPAALGLTALAAAAASTSALIEWFSLPADVERRAAVVVLPVLAVVIVAAAALAWRRRPPDPSPVPSRTSRRPPAVPALTGWGTLVALGLLTGWLVVRVSGLWEPVLVTSLDPTLERSLITIALGATVAAATLLVWSGSVRVPTRSRRRAVRPRSTS